MNAVLVDSNVLLDVMTGDPTWEQWSTDALGHAAEHATLVINPIIWAEVSVGVPTVELLREVLPEDLYVRRPLPWDAGFLAGKAFAAYRRRGGARRSPLPDFFIGAHAAVEQLRLLTRDATRYRRYFPGVSLICP